MLTDNHLNIDYWQKLQPFFLTVSNNIRPFPLYQIDFQRINNFYLSDEIAKGRSALRRDVRIRQQANLAIKLVTVWAVISNTADLDIVFGERDRRGRDTVYLLSI